jgi:hypothetical protein
MWDIGVVVWTEVVVERMYKRQAVTIDIDVWTKTLRSLTTVMNACSYCIYLHTR